MPLYPYPIIAKEGWPFLAVLILISVVSSCLFSMWIALFFWIATLFVLQFFRDPPRNIPVGQNLVLSPADGRVISVGKVFDPYVKREAIKISVFMNVFNVHSNRVPVDGCVEQIIYFPGVFFNADLNKASDLNERNVLVIHANEGYILTCVQVAGLIARRILCYTQPGDKVKRGERFGFIRFGSRVDVYLPAQAQPVVCAGDKVLATETVLARMPL